MDRRPSVSDFGPCARQQEDRMQECSMQLFLLRFSRLTGILCLAAQGDALLVTYMRDVSAILQLRSLATGVLVRELPMPGYGNVKELCARQSLSKMYYSYESLTDAGSTFT